MVRIRIIMVRFRSGICKLHMCNFKFEILQHILQIDRLQHIDHLLRIWKRQEWYFFCPLSRYLLICHSTCQLWPEIGIFSEFWTVVDMWDFALFSSTLTYSLWIFINYNQFLNSYFAQCHFIGAVPRLSQWFVNWTSWLHCADFFMLCG